MNSESLPRILSFFGLLIVVLILRFIAYKKRVGSVSTTPGTQILEENTDSKKSNAFLLSGSCTTGWLDWKHGEFWLLEEGLFRCTSGWLNTTIHVNQPVVGLQAKHGYVDIDKIKNLLHQDNSNKFIYKMDIEKYSISKGPLSGELKLKLKNGKSQKFLFLKDDMDYQLLRSTLNEWVGWP